MAESVYKEALRHRIEAAEVLEHKENYSMAIVHWAEKIMKEPLAAMMTRTKTTKATDSSKRARMHRALDAVLDARAK